MWKEFPTGPEGIFLKRGRSVHLEPQARPPFVRWVKGPDPRTDRLYYGKSFIYPLLASPFIMLWGTNGFLVLHALLLTACFGAVYAFVRARSGPAAALGVCRRVPLRLGGARVLRVADAGTVQPVARAPRALLLGLQGSGAGGRADGHVARPVGSPAPQPLVRRDRLRAARHRHVLQAAQRPGRSPHALARAPAAPVGARRDRQPRLRRGHRRALPGQRDQQRRHELPGRRARPVHVLRPLPVPDARVHLRQHRHRARDRRPAHRGHLQSRRPDDGAAAQPAVLPGRPAHGPGAVLLPGHADAGAVPVCRPAATRAVPVARPARPRAGLGRPADLHAVHVLGRRRSRRQPVLHGLLRPVPLPGARRPSRYGPRSRRRSWVGCSRRS